MFKFSQEGVTISLFFDRRRKTNDGKFPVKINVTYRRKPKYYPTGIYLSEAEWDRLSDAKKRDLVQTRNTLQNACMKLRHSVEMMLEKGAFSFDVLNAMQSGASGRTVNEAFAARIAKFKANDQIQTANLSQSTIRSLCAFAAKEIYYNDVTVEWLKRYEKFLLDEGKSTTTIGMYVRNLQTVFNEAIHDGYVDRSAYPFGSGRYEIPESVGRKMALPMAQLRQIFECDDGNKNTQQYFDLWRFSYLCNGANMNDILQL
jgi:hypothetical protein